MNVAINVSTTDQYLNVADSSVVSITGDMTIEAWYRPNNQPASGETFAIVSKYNTTGDQRSYYFAYTRPGAGGVRQFTLSISSDGITDVTKSVNANSANAVYTHMAVVYSASAGTATFYKDGSPMGSVQSGLPTSIFNSTSDLQIMGLSGVNGLSTGLIDEVRIWNVARSASEILANYNQEISASSSGLVAYYKFNENYKDYTSNANNLTEHGNIGFTLTVPFDAVTKLSKSSSPTWSNVSRSSTSWTSGGVLVQGGQPIGLLLALTYGNSISKPSTSWSITNKN